LSPVTAAELFFIAALLVSVAVLSRFWPMLAALSSDTTEALSPAFRSMHRAYAPAMTVLITGLALAWRRVVRELDHRASEPTRKAGAAHGFRGGRMAVAKWGVVVWLLILILIMTMPWRLLWNNDHPRALFRGERAYIVMERGPDLVVYSAERRVAERYRPGSSPDLKPQHTVGYLFESAEAFASAIPRH
jgi:hypothetical protein